MDLFVIRRRSNWNNPEELELTAAKSSAEGEKMSDEVRWIRPSSIAARASRRASGPARPVC